MRICNMFLSLRPCGPPPSSEGGRALPRHSNGTINCNLSTRAIEPGEARGVGQLPAKQARIAHRGIPINGNLKARGFGVEYRKYC